MYLSFPSSPNPSAETGEEQTQEDVCNLLSSICILFREGGGSFRECRVGEMRGVEEGVVGLTRTRQVG